MKIFSCFDGISGCQLAFKNLGIEFNGVDNIYYSSEISKSAMKITNYHFKNTVFLGDITKISDQPVFEMLSRLDLIIGGSPCQDLSVQGKQKGLIEGTRSSLFFNYLALIKKLKPRYIILENVASMKKEHSDRISAEFFNLKPVIINSDLFTAQSRKRLYWIGKFNDKTSTYEDLSTKLPKITPKDLYIKDILDLTDQTKLSPEAINKYFSSKRFGNRKYYNNQKHGTLNTFKSDVGYLYDLQRFINIRECEALQGFPKNYVEVEGVSISSKYEVLGNSFTIPVIEFILSNLII